MNVHIVTGLPGSGKTTVAKLISDLEDALIINTDEVRHMLYGFDPAHDDGDFTKEQVGCVYKVLGIVSKYLFSAKPRVRHVVFDGTFRDEEQRKLIIDMAVRHGVAVSVIYVYANTEVIKDRITRRYKNGIQMPTYDTYIKLKKIYRVPANSYELNNSSDVSSLRQELVTYLSKISKVSGVA